MKNIEISIREINVDDETLDDIEDIQFTTNKLVCNMEVFNGEIPHIIEGGWNKLKDYYLKNRDTTQFKKIRREYE